MIWKTYPISILVGIFDGTQAVYDTMTTPEIHKNTRKNYKNQFLNLYLIS